MFEAFCFSCVYSVAAHVKPVYVFCRKRVKSVTLHNRPVRSITTICRLLSGVLQLFSSVRLCLVAPRALQARRVNVMMIARKKHLETGRTKARTLLRNIKSLACLQVLKGSMSKDLKAVKRREQD